MRFLGDGLEPLPGHPRVSFYYDETAPAAQRFVIAHTWDHEPELEAAKVLRREAEEGAKGYSPSRELRRVASISPGLALKWLTEEGIDIHKAEHWPAIAAKLDSPEYLHIRTAPGRVSRRPHREFVQARRRNR